MVVVVIDSCGHEPASSSEYSQHQFTPDESELSSLYLLVEKGVTNCMSDKNNLENS